MLLALTRSPKQPSHLTTRPRQWRWTIPRLLQLATSSLLLGAAIGMLSTASSTIAAVGKQKIPASKFLVRHLSHGLWKTRLICRGFALI